MFILLVSIQLAFSFFGICSISVGGLSLEHGSVTEDQALGMYRMLSEVEAEVKLDAPNGLARDVPSPCASVGMACACLQLSSISCPCNMVMAMMSTAIFSGTCNAQCTHFLQGKGVIPNI